MKTRYARRIRRGVKEGQFRNGLARFAGQGARIRIYAQGYWYAWGLSKRAYERTWVRAEYFRLVSKYSWIKDANRKAYEYAKRSVE